MRCDRTSAKRLAAIRARIKAESEKPNSESDTMTRGQLIAALDGCNKERLELLAVLKRAAFYLESPLAPPGSAGVADEARAVISKSGDGR